MNPKIIDLDPIILAGVSFYGDPFETNNVWTADNQIGQLWQRFLAYLEKHRVELGPVFTENAGYEVHIRSDETNETGFYEVFVGMEIHEVDKTPVDLLVKRIPKSTYAIFTLRGSEIMQDWDNGIEQWVREHGYRVAFPFMFEYYDERYKGLDRIEESEVDFYIPIEKEA